MKKRLLALVALTLILAACGGTDTGDGVISLESDTTAVVTDDSVDEETTEEEALLSFSACMRDNGFDLEDPTVDSEGNLQLRPPANVQEGDFDPETAQAALQECEDLLEGITLGFGAADDTEFQDDVLAWAGCMWDNGYHIDDPDFTAIGPGGGGPGGGGPFGDIDQDDPDFQAAMEVCEAMLPGFGG
ncbi:MAG TPA: hypothetical protein ENH15_00790, partial [Actinobacteria bacterium]|nr:hypothetical protein [Actinomycetota bacterium]